ncbi:MAG: GTPase Era [Candidatus Kapabacteria bacterium]|nr:GTPase Era [Candidatus Kapabacteria bacterium]
MTRCATVALVGRPNAGKSTLLNAILGMHLSIVTNKPQTTRKRVLGIHTEGDSQLIFLDTPGLLAPKYQMQKAMMGYVDESLDAADIICIIVDVKKAFERGTIIDPMWADAIQKRKSPTILVLNKMDVLGVPKEAMVLMEQARLSGLFQQAIAISAKDNTFVEDLVALLRELSPEAPFEYDSEIVSDQSERFFVAEFIREAIFKQFSEEIPYAADVMIAEFKEREGGKWYIAADIMVERENQKAILIGAKGGALKQVGEVSRATIEKHLGRPVYLELYVKVRNDWRNDRTQLASLGY